MRLNKLRELFQRPLAFFLVLVILCALLTAACSGEAESREVLIGDEYRIMREGDVENFLQGYAVVLKGYGADAVLVEFYNNFSRPLFVGEAVLREGETVQCLRINGSSEQVVLMMTLDKLYINNSQAVAGFSHIYQYEESDTSYTEESQWSLKTAFLEQPSDPGAENPPVKNGDDINSDFISEPMYIILIIGLLAVAVIAVSFFFRKRIER